jgi:hypothetical protein
VRGLNRAAAQVVADGGPVGAFRDGGIDAVFFEQAFFMRDNDGRTIRQRDHAEIHCCGFRRVAGINAANPRFGQAGEQRGKRRAVDGLAEKLAAVQIMLGRVRILIGFVFHK